MPEGQWLRKVMSKAAKVYICPKGLQSLSKTFPQFLTWLGVHKESSHILICMKTDLELTESMHPAETLENRQLDSGYKHCEETWEDSCASSLRRLYCEAQQLGQGTKINSILLYYESYRQQNTDLES